MRKFFILISIPFIFTISFIGIQLFLPEEQLVDAQLLQKQMPQINCRSLIKKYRNSSSKINLVFVGHNFTTINDFTKFARKIVDYKSKGFSLGPRDYYTNDLNKIYGLLGTEPYKSNKNIFNFWYIDKIFADQENKQVCPEHPDEIESICPVENRYFINVCNYHTPTAAAAGVEDIALSIKNENNETDIANIGLINHELGGHALGKLSHPRPDSEYPSSELPLCYENFSVAHEKIKNMLGNGCGKNRTVDCNENCFKYGICKKDGYNTEIQYIAVNPEDCFNSNQPILGCSLDLERATVPKDGGFIQRKHIAFRAMLKNECQDSLDNCMYYENSSVFCFDKKIQREDRCDALTDINIYSDIPRHEKVTSCVFRPYLWDIMNSSLALKFSPINEKEICRRLKEKLGSIRGICAIKYRLK